MKKILLSVAIWASVFGAVSRASLDTGSAEVVETLGLRDQQIYFETEKICQESQSLLGTFFNKNTSRAFWISAGEFFSLTLGNLFGTGVSSSTMQVASSSRELQEMAANYREHNLVGDYTYDRLQSAGFELALTRCYVNRPDLKRDFVVSMMAADTAGKVPSVMLMLIGAR